jgi:hypothetical protein
MERNEPGGWGNRIHCAIAGVGWTGGHGEVIGDEMP